MPLPQWLARFNRRFINPGAVKKGNWPVLVHRGRSSGKVYRTPLDVFSAEDGYLFTVNYGSKTDWFRNVLAAGKATLEMDGRSIQLTDPKVLTREDGYAMMESDAEAPPPWVGVQECLLLNPVKADSEA
jgi:deazaflavin-dependent oxidoreductase (nitroreductase family)